MSGGGEALKSVVLDLAFVCDNARPWGMAASRVNQHLCKQIQLKVGQIYGSATMA